MMLTKGRLINVSNRLPVVIKKTAAGTRVERSSGGLASALESWWRDQPGIWIGWAGSPPGHSAGELLSKSSRRRSHALQAVDLTEDEIAKFYAGFANEIVWPLFHDMPSRCNFDPGYWEIYQQVNKKFAAATAQSAHEDDLIWVHDYHLMLMARYLRESGNRCRAGFFLHIPFPSPDIFEKLPWRDQVLQGLLQFDLVGFQTDRDRLNFLNCLDHVFPAGCAPQHPALKQGKAKISTFPISINFDEFAHRAGRPEVAVRAATIRADFNENILVLGVDRLDYTKGIPERLKAFRILLQRFPELRRQITLAQVVVPSREDIPKYRDLRLEIELLVSQINGEFSERGWVPVHYMHRNLGRDELLAHYRAADVALITPLKDGMNLVAKEFCAAQVDERGAMIISEFAGASEELCHGAILVNPNDLAGVAQCLRDAAVMPKEEKSTRMRLMRNIVKEHDVERWARSFLEAMEEAGAPAARGGEKEPIPIRARERAESVPGVALVAASHGSRASGKPEVRTA